MATNPVIVLSLDGLDPVLADDLRRLADGRAAGLAPLTVAEALRLVAQADRIRAAAERTAVVDDAAAHLPRSVPFGGLLLKSPTLAVEILLETATTWTGVTADWYQRFICYCLHYADDPKALAAVATRDGALRTIGPEFCALLTGHQPELDAALRLLFHGPGTEPNDTGAPPETQKKSPPTGPASSSASSASAAAPPPTGSITSPAPMPFRSSVKPPAPTPRPKTAPTPSKKTP